MESLIEIDEIGYFVSFSPTKISIGNSGIGSYEFWGHKGSDKGTDFVEDFEISGLRIFDPETDKEIAVEPSIRE
jgi:hypothetical protein